MAKNLYLGNGDWATTKGSTLFYTVENGIYEGVPSEVIRNSEANTKNKDGVLETVDVDTSAIDYTNSVNGTLRLEDESTNYSKHSNNFDSWSKGRSSVVPNQGLDIFGENNVWKFNDSTDAGTHRIYNTGSSVPMVLGEVWYVRCWVKKSELSGVRLAIRGTTETEMGTPTDFDLENGTITNGEGSITPWGDGWYECVAKVTITTTQNGQIFAYTIKGGGTSYVGTGTDGVYIQHMTLEKGQITSYIENDSTVQNTRAADSLINVGREELFNSADLTLSCVCSSIANGGKERHIRIINSDDTNRIVLRFSPIANEIRLLVRQNGVNIVSLFYSGLDQTVKRKYDIVANASGFKLYADDQLLLSDNTPNTFNDLSTLDFGKGTDVFGGIVESLQVYDNTNN